MKAELQQQWRLLDLQKLDTRLDQIDHRLANLPQAKELAELTKKADTATEEMILAQTAVMDVEREIARSEADVQQVRDRAARDKADRVAAGMAVDAGEGMSGHGLIRNVRGQRAPDRPAADGVEARPERQQQQREGAVGRGPAALRRPDECDEDQVLLALIGGGAVQPVQQGRRIPERR